MSQITHAFARCIHAAHICRARDRARRALSAQRIHSPLRYQPSDKWSMHFLWFVLNFFFRVFLYTTTVFTDQMYQTQTKLLTLHVRVRVWVLFFFRFVCMNFEWLNRAFGQNANDHKDLDAMQSSVFHSYIWCWWAIYLGIETHEWLLCDMHLWAMFMFAFCRLFYCYCEPTFNLYNDLAMKLKWK